jgi:Co/Zn/Cd efflux system component
MTAIPYNLEEAKRNKKALWIVFWIHFVMFFVVFTAGIIAESSALLADSLDFIGDAANYALTMFVMSRGVWMRATASILKAVTMIGFGVPMLFYAVSRYSTQTVPNYEVMNEIGMIGIVAHLVCIYYLYRFRKGDSNLLSVWICTINDLVSNVLIVIASYFVMRTNSIVPDVIAATIIVTIALYGACVILNRALSEIKALKQEKEQEKEYVGINS